ncbi:MAG: hypothetical protein Q8M31_18425 [Beijerinckiaceae bacterium]|nr:hypothetical protein [Beijerinckiaceae bacterium]
MKLADHFTTAGVKPFEYGKADCCTFACDWVLAVRGVDPMASWRGQYDSEAGAFRRIADRGGMIDCVSDEMRAAGLAETDDPIPGDVGLVRYEKAIMLAIRASFGWACKMERGFLIAPLECVKAWRVIEPRRA